MALDEPNDKDDVFEVNGFKFVIEQNLMKEAKFIKVDMSYMGFSVESGMVMSGGSCSSCGPGGCS